MHLITRLGGGTLLLVLLLLLLLDPAPVSAINQAEILKREDKYHPVYYPKYHYATIDYMAENVLDCKFLRWKAFLKRGNGFCDGLPPYDPKTGRTLVEECIHKYRKEAKKCFLAIRGVAPSYHFAFTFNAHCTNPTSCPPPKNLPTPPSLNSTTPPDEKSVHVHFKDHNHRSDWLLVEDVDDQKKRDEAFAGDTTHPLASGGDDKNATSTTPTSFASAVAAAASHGKMKGGKSEHVDKLVEDDEATNDFEAVDEGDKVVDGDEAAQDDEALEDDQVVEDDEVVDQDEAINEDAFVDSDSSSHSHSSSSINTTTTTFSLPPTTNTTTLVWTPRAGEPTIPGQILDREVEASVTKDADCAFIRARVMDLCGGLVGQRDEQRACKGEFKRSVKFCHEAVKENKLPYTFYFKYIASKNVAITLKPPLDDSDVDLDSDTSNPGSPPPPPPPPPPAGRVSSFMERLWDFLW